MLKIYAFVILFHSVNIHAANNEQVELLLARAEIATNRNQWIRALDYLDQVLKLNPIFQKAIELKINILEEQKNYLEAIRLYKRLIRKEILEQQKTGKIQPSQKTLGHIFSLARSYYSLYINNRGKAEDRNYYFERAVKWFRVIRGHKYALAFANYFLGHLHYVAENYYQAMTYFESADPQLDFKDSGDIKLLNRFFLAACLNALGRSNEAIYHLMYVYQNIDKNKDLKAPLLEFLNSLSRARISGALSLAKVFDTNVSSLEGQSAATEADISGLANELRLTLQYNSYTLKRFTWRTGFVFSLLEQDEDKFDEFSYRTMQPYVNFKYTKFKKEWFEIDYSYSKVQTKVRDSESGQKDFVTFSNTHSLTPAYTKINPYGDFTLKLPFFFTSFEEAGIKSTQTYLISGAQKFYPANQWIDFSPEFQFGIEQTGSRETDKLHTNLYLNNSSALSWMLLRQSLFIERGQIYRSSGSETSLGAAFTSYIYLNWPFGQTTFTLNYTLGHDLFHLPSGNSKITKHIFKIGLEKYF